MVIEVSVIERKLGDADDGEGDGWQRVEPSTAYAAQLKRRTHRRAERLGDHPVHDQRPESCRGRRQVAALEQRPHRPRGRIGSDELDAPGPVGSRHVAAGHGRRTAPGALTIRRGPWHELDVAHAEQGPRPRPPAARRWRPSPPPGPPEAARRAARRRSPSPARRSRLGRGGRGTRGPAPARAAACRKAARPPRRRRERRATSGPAGGRSSPTRSERPSTSGGTAPQRRISASGCRRSRVQEAISARPRSRAAAPGASTAPPRQA